MNGLKEQNLPLLREVLLSRRLFEASNFLF